MRCSRSRTARRCRGMPTPGGTEKAHPARAERVARPGRHGLQALALPTRRPRRRIPPRVHPLDDDVERAGGGRVDRLAGRDGEAPQLPAVEVGEAVQAAVDQDHRPGHAACEARLDRGRLEVDRQARVGGERVDDARDHRAGLELAPDPVLGDQRRSRVQRQTRRRPLRVEPLRELRHVRAQGGAVDGDDELDVRRRGSPTVRVRSRPRCMRSRTWPGRA